ncbi:MAG: hypothetical protein COT67_01155 [Candidatus Tagabacteria bacterium CG09_land_8_20_14_0_10_41_14]|uniref:Type II secretion system protein J n=2 Tax=Candidatus Tagaibacteriota TaxID=1817918 RepID=A0A2H0WNP8_9BACT|nr:MAG: hypothetical protein COT67_01155 [Candidatus Tagabacteria bacterium CG09_land_8_20_14_0_10_41_14]PJE73191.1 MAG: hypothetical protein COV00_01145 [Candidatus Tagabacteria bacterium CG10_big_fil_rev_8_21_14_0_10_40_13]
MKKGLTIIETLAAIGIFTLLMVTVSSLIISIYRSQDYSWQQAMAINEARRGIEIMSKEIREARDASDGSYVIEKAEDKEFIFYSDIDDDGKAERVRYFLGTVGSGGLTRECQTFFKGGSCEVNFSDFLEGDLVSASVKVSVDGDFGWKNREYAEIFSDGEKLGDVCRVGCSDCPSTWQGTATYDVTGRSADDSVNFLADATNKVDPLCSHSMKARFEFEFTEDLSAFASEFRKGVIEPVGDPPIYPVDQEEISILTSYVRNAPPIFEYFDADGNKIIGYPARLADTKLMKLHLVINVSPDRPPTDFELESFVQLRNLKLE